MRQSVRLDGSSDRIFGMFVCLLLPKLLRLIGGSWLALSDITRGVGPSPRVDSVSPPMIHWRMLASGQLPRVSATYTPR